MSTFKRYTILCFICLSGYTQSWAQTSKFQHLSELERQGTQVSALVLRMKDGKILAQISPNKHLIPASTTKLVVASQALEKWGPNKTFTSHILSRGTLHDGVLTGDLVFLGGGDPALINENLSLFTQEVIRSGIKKVTGKLIVNNSLFGQLKPDNARAHGKFFSENAYDSPLSAAALNYSVLGLLVSSGQKIGAKASVKVDPYAIPSVSIVNLVKTTKRGSKTHLSASRSTRKGLDTYTVKGNIALGGQDQKIYRSVSDADRYAGETIVSYLQHAGVEMTQTKIAIESTSPLKTDKIVATIKGSPLSEQLNGLLQMSNNFIADMLFLNLNASSESYMQSVVSDNSVVLKSGSGLTPENRLSAKNLVDLLQRNYADKERFNIFLNSLTIPGQIGTLQDRFKKFSKQNTNVFFRAKTGSLTEPYAVVSLAGYGRNQEGDWISFAFIINGNKAKNSPNILQLRNALDTDLTAFLQSGAHPYEI